MPTLSQRSFGAGELTPSLHARTGYDRYGIGLKTLRNFYILKHGGAQNRPGTIVSAEVGDSSNPVRTVPFIFSNDVSFSVEMGEYATTHAKYSAKNPGYVRFHTNGQVEKEPKIIITAIDDSTHASLYTVTTETSHRYSEGDEVFITDIGRDSMTQVSGRYFIVNDTGLTATQFTMTDKAGDTILHTTTSYTGFSGSASVQRIYEVSTPFSSSDIFEVNLESSGDVITMAHPSYQPVDLKRYYNASSVEAFDITSISALVTDGIVVVAGGNSFVEGDRISLKDIAGSTQLNDLDFTVVNPLEINEITCDTLANTNDGEYFDYDTSAGTSYRVYFDTTGASATIPDTDGRTLVEVDISGDVTAANVATTLEVSMEALTNITATVASDVVTCTDDDNGNPANATIWNLRNAWDISNISSFEIKEVIDYTKLTAYSSGGVATLVAWESVKSKANQPFYEGPVEIASSGGTGTDTTYEYLVTAIDLFTGAESYRGVDTTDYFIDDIYMENGKCIVETDTTLDSNFEDYEGIILRNVLGVPEAEGNYYRGVKISSTKIQLVDVDCTKWGTYEPGTGTGIGRLTHTRSPTVARDLASVSDITVSWNSIPDVAFYNIYRRHKTTAGSEPWSAWGKSDTVFPVSGSSTESYIDGSHALGLGDENLPPTLRDSLFTRPSHYPSVVSFYQQRKIFASTLAEPEKIWMSAVGEFDKFQPAAPIIDSDTVIFSLAGNRVAKVEGFVDLGNLMVMTQGGEWQITGGSGGAITPSTINAKQYSYNGSGTVSPVVVNGSAVYLQSRARITRDLAFDFTVDGYKGDDLSINSSHLFKDFTILDWDYQQNDNSVIWAVRSDGQLLGMTYIKEQEMTAWHHHDTDGTVESVCTVPEGTEDALYIVVKRTIKDAAGADIEKRYIERMVDRNILDQVDNIFSDSSLTYDGRNTTTTKEVAITNAAGAQTITAATNANPASITISGHGYLTGNKVTLTGMASTDDADTDTPDWDTLDGVAYTMTVVDDDTFTLDGTDTTQFEVWTAGTATRWGYSDPLLLEYTEDEGEAAKAITAGTSVNPPVLTFKNHGLVTGDLVYCDSFAPSGTDEWDDLNGNSYWVTKVTDDTFSIDVDASGFGVWSAGNITKWVYPESLFYYDEDLTNEVHMYNGDDTIRFRINGEPNSRAISAFATVLPAKDVPVTLHGTATDEWAKAVDNVAGLWTLEGKKVAVVGDGFVAANPDNSSYVLYEVENGKLDKLDDDEAVTGEALDKPYSLIHVGLPYTSDLETLNIDSSGSETLMDKKVIVSEVTVFLEESRGIWVGAKPPSDDDTDNVEGLIEMKPLDETGSGDVPALRTDTVDVIIRPEWNSNGRVFVRQIDPVPCTILAVAPSGKFPFKNKQGGS